MDNKRRAWVKSTRSANQGDCVETYAEREAAAILVRDSKLGDSSPVFSLANSEWANVLRALKA